MSDSTTGSEATDGEVTEKAGGKGTDGTIPANPDGLAANLGDEGSNFNAEEDPEADATDGAGSATV